VFSTSNYIPCICLKYPYYLNNPITYNIHISQIATPNRAPTQAADFSQAEESSDTNENEDWLSWQTVSGSGKKKQAPEPQKCQQ
jgi:hypothetical protein